MSSRIVSAIVRIGSNILELLTIKERRKDRKERKDEVNKPVEAAEEIRHAVADGDEDKVNQMLEDARLNRIHGGKAVSVIILGLTVWGSVFMYGCVAAKRPHVLSADRHCVKMEMNGIPGWFVPEAQFADLSAAYMAEQARMKLREEIEDSRREP